MQKGLEEDFWEMRWPTRNAAVQSCTANESRPEDVLIKKGLVCGSSAQTGGFLRMLASIGVPLKIDLVKKL